MAVRNSATQVAEAETQQNKQIFDDEREQPVDSEKNQNGVSGMDARKVSKSESVLDKSIVNMTPPRIFSMVKNTEGSIEFFNALEQNLEVYDEVIIDFRNIEYVSSDGLLVLHSKVIDARGQARGIFPDNEVLYNKFRDSGFFGDEISKSGKRSRGKMSRQTKRVEDFPIGIIDKDAPSYKTGLEISLDEVDKTLEFIANSVYNGKRLPPIRTIFVALMENTVEHAADDPATAEYWRYSYYHDKEKKSVRFNFLDYGIGITESVKLKWQNEREKRFSRSESDKILKAALAGKVTISTREKPKGGQGLPSILDTCKRNRVDNLVVITNEAKAEVKEDEIIYTKLQRNFGGTFIHWEIDETNKSICETS